MRLIKLKAMKRIDALRFTPDGRKLLAVGGAEAGAAHAAVWVDVAEGAEVRRHLPMAFCGAVSADLTQLALGNPSELDVELPPVVVCDPSAPSLRPWRVILPHARTATEVYGMAFDAAGRRLAVSYCVADRSGYHTKFRLAVFPLGRGQPVEVIERDSEDFITGRLAFSPDGRLLACDGGVGEKSAVKVLDAKTLAPVHRIFPPGSQTRHLIFSPNGGTLAVTNGRNVSLHSSESSTPPVVLEHPKQANAVAFTPDGTRLFSTCHDHLVREWEVTGGRLVTSYDWGIGQTVAVAVSPDGTTAAASGGKGQIVVFDLGA